MSKGACGNQGGARGNSGGATRGPASGAKSGEVAAGLQMALPRKIGRVRMEVSQAAARQRHASREPMTRRLPRSHTNAEYTNYFG